MAWVRARRRSDGGITYTVTWREPGDSEESTLSVRDDKALADQQVRLLDANGQSYSAAKRAAANAKIGGDTVKGAILTHVDQLINAGPDQLHRYRQAARNHFGGLIGAIPVAALEHDDIVAWIRLMQSKGLSAKTIANHHGLLSAALTTAVRQRLRPDNPCNGVRLPRDTSITEKMRVMTAEDSLDIVQAHPERYRPLVAFLRATGARFGEATALLGGDFQLDVPQPVVRIEKAWKRDGNNRFYIGPPKTKKSRRTISLPPSLVEYIRPAVTTAGKNGTVFTTSTGGPIRHSKFHEFWSKALDSLGYAKYDRPRIHDLRHTSSGLMLAGGMNIYELSRRLGHNSITTTIDRYADLLPDAQFRGADIAETTLGKMPAVGEIEDNV